ncbi:MAG: GNAT family N-acetyltransferase [Promethearchaeota archaeon]
MEVKDYRIKDLDIQELSAFIMEVKKASGQWQEETTLDNVENSMNLSFANTDDIVVIAEENRELLGCLLLHLKEENQAEANPWFLKGLPIVKQEYEDTDVAKQLISKSMDCVRDRGITRLEMSFPREKHTGQLKLLLQQCGLTITEEIVHMRRTISELTIDAPEIPKSIESRSLLQVGREDLFACWFDSFLQGQDRSFLSRGQKERRAFFNKAFDFTEEMIEAASLALVHDSAVIGFSLVRPTHGEENGHLWQMGVHPKYRGKGLAKYLLSEAKEQLRELGFVTMSLNVDTANIPAYDLYKKIGLLEDWCLVSYAWSLSLS